MTMKKFLIWMGLILSALISCTGDDGFLINGQFHDAGGIHTVVLYEGNRKLDSVFLSENGKFKFRRTAPHPRLFTLEAGGNKYHIIAQNGERISVVASLSQSSDEYEVSGSVLSGKIKEFAETKNKKERFEADLEEEFVERAAGLDDVALQGLRQDFLQRHRKAMVDYTKAAVDFASKHDDLAGFFAMSTLDPDIAEAELIAYSDKISGKYDDNAIVRQFLEETERLRRLAIGQPAPEFESYTASNQVVRLSDFKGKYTLIDFWASWCVPCREENPNIVRQYEAFKDKGFTVLGVSLDGNPGPWLRAIKEDGLAWVNVSDLQAWGSEVVGLYRILAIPTSYLVDPEGIIIAKNLRGDELEGFLKKTLP